MTQPVYTGERVIPELQQGDPILVEHLLRYMFSCAFARGKRVLDVACGSGYGSQMLADAGARAVYSIDRDEKTIAYARERHGAENIRFLAADALDLPLADRSVDLVVSFETIEHLKDVQRFLREIKRVLDQEGMLLLSTPNRETYPGENPFHTREFTPAELETIVRSVFRYTWTRSQFSSFASLIGDPEHVNKHHGRFGSPAVFCHMPASLADCLYSIVAASDSIIEPPDDIWIMLFRPPWLHSWIELFGERAERDRREALLREKDRLIQLQTDQLAMLHSSASWRLTKPLRDLKRFAHAILRQKRGRCSL
ncbi:MAG: putative glycosyltransferase [Parcubacteria group bacterium Gr01-1014_38]|nr:MAG: putative glycosyltransferase [Parcubacteria group bacterium Gr01-1014_38]